MELYIDDECVDVDHLRVDGEPTRKQGHLEDPRLTTAKAAVASSKTLSEKNEGLFIRGERRLAVYTLKKAKNDAFQTKRPSFVTEAL